MQSGVNSSSSLSLNDHSLASSNLKPCVTACGASNDGGFVPFNPDPKTETTAAVVGFGRQAQSKGLAGLQDSKGVVITAIVDPDVDIQIPSSLPGAIKYASVDDMLASSRPEYAYVAVPHYLHTTTVIALLRAGVNVIKEKPFATNVNEAELIRRTAKETRTRVAVAAQRRFSDRYATVAAWLPRIGRVHAVHAVETIVEPHLDQGWRASRFHAGGGVVIDLGYHMLDQLIGLFGSDFRCVQSYLMKTNRGDYDVEDTAHISISFQNAVHVSLILSRASFEREELLEIIGERGMIRLKGKHVHIAGTGNHDIGDEHFESNQSSKECISRAFQSIFDPTTEPTLERDFNVMRLIDEIYLEARGNAMNSPSTLVSRQHCPQKWVWPRITSEMENDIQRQLHTSISIYDNSGIFAVFESEFKAYHCVPDSHALLHNSGTNALFSLFYASGIGKGDEVIVPVYTFHATVSPLMLLGALPVFADTWELSGNLSPDAVRNAIGPRTKAVVITHMWGIPCAMDEIVSVCTENNVLLLEDCSHAHGAKIGGKFVGTFGDGAAWSLQGEKVITGGEGGITITPHADMHYRQLIIGHYNKRCKKEIPSDHPLRPFSLTGAGLKNRAHPLAVSIALGQLRLLPAILEHKAKFADYIITYLRDVSFLLPPELKDGIQPSWYALVFLFDQSKAPFAWTRERYVAALHARGLKDVDIPASTKPLMDEALYLRPWEVLPHIYSKEDYHVDNSSQQGFPNAKYFYQSAIKLPVWGFGDDWEAVKIYAEIMKQVAVGAEQNGIVR